MQNPQLIFLAFVALFYMSCGGTRNLQKVELPVTVTESAVFEGGFTGFTLYDPARREYVYEQNADKLFTPASNTKILTLYAATQLLPEQVPAIRYLEQGDTLIFWGTGDPGNLNPFLPDNGLVEFLRNRPERNLLYCAGNFQDDRYGAGWMWDDYGYYFQPEKSPLPLYGNMVRFVRDPREVGFFVQPAVFANLTVLNPNLGGTGPLVVRRETENIFEYNPRALTGTAYEKYLPYRIAPELTQTLLRDTVARPVRLLNIDILPPPDAPEVLGSFTDDLLREMMHESDNFIAEQLLLLISNEYFAGLNTDAALQLATDSLYNDLPQPIRWVDGSGLSRYNLVSPRDLTTVLERLYFSMPQNRLFDLFPAGGQHGTIQNWYAGEDGQPYVWAKTGTLRGVHCLSGYLITDSGKVLIFSFMHNNIPGASKPYKEEMERILSTIRRTYK